MSILSTVPRTQLSTELETPGMEFRAVATRALASVRASFRLLLAGLRQPVRRAADAQRALGIGRVLGWQVFRLANAEDPLLAAPFVPRSEALSKILSAANQNGVSETVLREVEAACAAFEVVVREHAGDRGAFESMISMLGDADAGDGMGSLRDRRAAFRSSSNLWGVSAHTKVACSVCHPTPDGIAYDVLNVWGNVGVKQLRAGVNLHVSSRSGVSSDPSWRGILPGIGIEEASHRVPIESAKAVGLLEQFCSRPLPILIARDSGQGIIDLSMELRGVGRASSVTYYLRRFTHAGMKRDEGPQNQVCFIAMPTEHVVIDMLIPAGDTDPGTAGAAVYGRLNDVHHALQTDARDRLPINVSNTYLGSSLADLHIPDAPKYPEMVRHLLEEQGWQNTAFDIYRCRLQYPLLHTAIRASVAGPGASSRTQEP